MYLYVTQELMVCFLFQGAFSGSMSILRSSRKWNDTNTRRTHSNSPLRPCETYKTQSCIQQYLQHTEQSSGQCNLPVAGHITKSKRKIPAFRLARQFGTHDHSSTSTSKARDLVRICPLNLKRVNHNPRHNGKIVAVKWQCRGFHARQPLADWSLPHRTRSPCQRACSLLLPDILWFTCIALNQSIHPNIHANIYIPTYQSRQTCVHACACLYLTELLTPGTFTFFFSPKRPSFNTWLDGFANTSWQGFQLSAFVSTKSGPVPVTFGGAEWTNFQHDEKLQKPVAVVWFIALFLFFLVRFGRCVMQAWKETQSF